MNLFYVNLILEKREKNNEHIYWLLSEAYVDEDESTSGRIYLS